MKQLDKYTLAYLYSYAKSFSDNSANSRLMKVIEKELAKQGMKTDDEIRQYVNEIYEYYALKELEAIG